MNLRVLVVGAGSHIFRAAHIPALRACGVEIAGVCDPDLGRIAQLVRERNVPAATSTAELSDVAADFAVVCTPHPLHRGAVRECLDRGLPVLVEKPLAPRLREIDEIARAADAAGAVVGVVHQHRLRAEAIAAARMIEEGRLGRIHRAALAASYPKRSGYYSATPWRGTWQGEGGGVLLNQGLHDIDLLVSLLGRPAAVTALMRSKVHPIQAEDTADLLIEWTGGAVASMHVTSAARVDSRLEVFGTRGGLRLTSAGLEVRRVEEDFDVFAASAGGAFDDYPVSDWELHTIASGGTHADVYRDFLSAWREGRRPAVDPAGARTAVEVIAAAQLSSRERSTRELPVDTAQFDRFLDDRIAATR